MTGFNRRELLGQAGAATALLLVGGSAIAAVGKAAAKPLPSITMYRSPSCGCCVKWADAARAAGFKVETVSVPDVQAIKARLKVPNAVMSCHTSVVGKYVVEGHVPFDPIKKMLRTQPDIIGIGVAGMPLGAPGMEVHGQGTEPFQVMAFNAAGKISRYA